MNGSEIRQLPAQDQRVESGPVQFGDDWPGVFIRGDDAGVWAMQLKLIIEHYLPDDPLNIAMLKGLQDTLASCVVGPATDLVKVSGGSPSCESPPEREDSSRKRENTGAS